MCIVDFQVGAFGSHSTFASISPSLISSKNSPRQYHCSPGGNSPSKAVFQTGNGMGATPSSSGLPNERASRSAVGLLLAGLRPDDRADLAQVQLLGERRPGRDRQEGEPAAELVRRRAG